MKVKVESEKVGLKLNIHKMKIMASGPIPSQQIDREKVETMTDFIFLEILSPAYASISTAFNITYSAYKLNMKGDNKQP